MCGSVGFGVTKLKTIGSKQNERKKCIWTHKKMSVKILVGYSNRQGFELNYI